MLESSYIIRDTDEFVETAKKNKGVERGFFGILLNIHREELQKIKEEEYSILDVGNRFDLLIVSLISGLEESEKIRILDAYVEFKKECGENEETHRAATRLQRAFGRFEIKREKAKAFVECVKLYNHSIFSKKNIGNTDDAKYFKAKHKKKQKGLPSSELKKLNPAFIVKGDRSKVLGMSLTDPSIKSLIRNIFEDHFMGCERANRNAIGELFALKFVGLLGGIPPKNAYIINEEYSDGTPKFMIATSLHEDFRDLEGLLIDSNTGKEQKCGVNYNRLISDRGSVIIDGKRVKIQHLAKNSMIFCFLNDLDGFGAQGQNVGTSSKGKLLYFDFGHSFKNTPNIGSGFIPQLVNGNVKSRNIASFFSGVSLYYQIKAFNEVIKIFEDGSFNKFILNFRENIKNLNTEYASHVDTLEAKILKRYKYIKKVFENRKNIIKSESGRHKINLLENLQFLTFRRSLSKYSKSGVILKEGTSYFNMKKIKGKDLYIISLEGDSFYDKDYEYFENYVSLVKEFRGHSKNPHKFSKNELILFAKFLQIKRLKQVKQLNDSRITGKIQKEIGKIEEIIDSQKSISTDDEYLSSRATEAKKFISSLKSDTFADKTSAIGISCRFIREHAAAAKGKSKISDVEYAKSCEAAIVSKKIEEAKSKSGVKLTKKDVKRMRQEITTAEFVEEGGGIYAKSSVGLKAKVFELLGSDGKKTIELHIEESTSGDKFGDKTKYIITIENLGKNVSLPELIGSIRDYGFGKGVRKVSRSAKILLLNQDRKPLERKELKSFIGRLNTVETTNSKGEHVTKLHRTSIFSRSVYVH